MMTKRQESAERTRQKIIEASKKLITEKGLDAVKIDDIAQEAGVSKGSFYTYFKHKEDVLLEIAYSRFDSIDEESQRVSDDPVYQLSSYLQGSIEFIADSGVRLCQGWVSSVASPDDRVGKDKLCYDRKKISSLLSLDEDHRVVTSILMEYYGIVFCWALSNGATDPVSEMRAFCKGPLQCIINGQEKR